MKERGGRQENEIYEGKERAGRKEQKNTNKRRKQKNKGGDI